MKGIDEGGLMSSLPNSIRYDIFIHKYRRLIENSNFFYDKSNKVDYRILYSFCKKFRTEIFMENDFIISSGQRAHNVYLILDGEVELMKDSTNKQVRVILNPGKYFGGLGSEVIQLQNIRAT